MTEPKRDRGSLVIKGDRVIARIRCGTDSSGKPQRVEQRIPWAHGHDADSIAAANVRLATLAELAAMLLESGRADLVKKTVAKAATALDKNEVLVVQRAVQAIVRSTALHAKRTSIVGTTFKEFCERWTSGELAKTFPDQVAAIDQELNAQRAAKYIYPHVGSVPLVAFGLDQAQLVMSKLPERKSGTRRHVGQIINRVLNLAVFPAKLIDRNPLPKGFLPKKGKPPHYPYLYPDEELALLGCADVPEVFRLFVGVLDREGMRISELRDSDWWQWSLDVPLGQGTFTLPKNKTDEPRLWKITEDTHEALLMFRDQRGGRTKGTDRVFAALDTVTAEHVADYHAKRKGRGGKEPKALVPRKTEASYLRAALVRAGVTRRELHASTEHSGKLRAHDLRATFVTYAVRAGRPESWITDRTGHTTIAMMKRYQRAARHLAELGHVSLPRLVEALGWVSAWVSGAGSEGSSQASESGKPVDGHAGAKEGGRTPTAFRPPEPESARSSRGAGKASLLPSEGDGTLRADTRDTQSTPNPRHVSRGRSLGGSAAGKVAAVTSKVTPVASTVGLARVTALLEDGRGAEVSVRVGDTPAMVADRLHAALLEEGVLSSLERGGLRIGGRS